VDVVEVVMEVVVTVTTPGMEVLWGEPGMMMEVRVAPLWEVEVEVEARMTGTDMERWNMLEADTAPDCWPDWLVTKITCNKINT
jgi:hypothetical protein